MTGMRGRSVLCATLLAVLVGFAAREAAGQEVPLGWEAVQFFRYNIETIEVSSTPADPASPGTVKVIFFVTNPQNGNAPWDIKSDAPFKGCPAPCPVSPAPSSSLTVDIGWNTAEHVNTGSRFDPATGLFSVAPIPVNATTNRGTGAAFPIRINALTTAKPCDAAACPGVTAPLRFWLSARLPPEMIAAVQTGAVGSGVAAMEGHPVWPPAAPTENVPVRSVFAYFPIADSIMSPEAVAVPRRKIVDFDTRCHACHDGNHAGIPRLALHGGNRNEEPGVCVVCHNPNQTDIPFRSPASPPSTDPLGRRGVAAEVSVDFKRMVHEIHAGGFRRTPFKVVGFNGAVNDFSGVRFPGRLSNCLACHVLDASGKGTFELPLDPAVLGSTVQTASTIGPDGNLVDLDPTNNLRITPIASVCSSCHDGSEARSHMRSNGAVFGALQSAITPNPERCVRCHGPGKDKAVKKVHLDDDGDDD